MNQFTEILRASNRAWILMGVTATISATAGAAAGYAYAKKKVGEEAREIIDREIIETRKFYMNLNEQEKSENSPADIVAKQLYEEARQVIVDYSGTPDPNEYTNPAQVKAVQESILTSVFDSEGDHDATEVAAPADRSVPYLITSDTFVENEWDHSQNTITYYEGDNVLADEHDEPIPITVLGDNLGNFGRGTTDSRIMYVRNERLGVDFEVIQHSGKFAQVVHGLGD